MAQQQLPVVEAFKFLAESFYDECGKTEDSQEWNSQEYAFPFSTDDSEVTLSDYYGDCHGNLLSKSPKVLSYRRCNTEEDVVKAKIEAQLRSMADTVSSESSCRLEIDFIKLLFICPNNFGDRPVTIGDLESKLEEKNSSDRLQIRMIRANLSSGPDALIGVLENLGATLTNRESISDTLRCVCFRKIFSHNNRSFDPCLFVDPSDLVFCYWQSTTYPGKVLCLANPGPENDTDDEDFVCDIRIKAYTEKKASHDSVIVENADEFQQLWNNLGVKPPRTLTEPGLDGLFQRKGDEFECKPNAHIFELLEKTNKVCNHFEIEGFKMLLITLDGREFNVDRRSGRCKPKCSCDCWPKLMFLLDDADQIPELVDLAYRCVVALFDAFWDRRVEMRPWRFFQELPGGVSVPSVSAQLLRRIRENDSLEGMLGVSGKQKARVLSNHLAEVLLQMEGIHERVADEPRRRLLAAAKARSIEPTRDRQE